VWCGVNSTYLKVGYNYIPILYYVNLVLIPLIVKWITTLERNNKNPKKVLIPLIVRWITTNSQRKYTKSLVLIPLILRWITTHELSS